MVFRPTFGHKTYCTCTPQAPCDLCGGHEEAFKANVRYMMHNMREALGAEYTEEESRETPRRIFGLYKECLAGYQQDPEEILSKRFKKDFHEVISIKNIDFVSLCAHHWMPFVGVVHFGYLPKDGQVVGLSKIPRLVECFARRFQSQENMTQQIVDTFYNIVKPEGCIVVSEADHMCYRIRGPKSQGTTIVSAVRGCFRKNNDIKHEFFRQIGK